MKRLRDHEEEEIAKPGTVPAVETASNTSNLKIIELDESAIDDSDTSVAMRCTLPGHREVLTFESYAAYEAHYHKAHSNRCTECKRNFPSNYLLSIHIEEAHDAFAAVRRDQGERTYSCFVESCGKKCRTPQKRKMHLIAKHLYPKNYFFAVTRDGIDGRNSLLLDGGHHRRTSSASHAGSSKLASRRQSLQNQTVESDSASQEKAILPVKKSGSSSPELTSADESKGDAEMTDLTSAMSSLQFVPPSVRFGRGRGRAGFARR